MFCGQCGAKAAEGSAFCSSCGQPIAGHSGQAPVGPTVPESFSSAPSVYIPPPLPERAPGMQPAVAYAGFWLRAVAAIIDGIIVVIPTAPFAAAIFFSSFRNIQDLQTMQDPTALMETFAPKFAILLFVSVFLSWLYWGLCESSGWQATLGKKALGLVVTDMEGRRISFARASGRFFTGRGFGSIPYLGGLYFFIDCICVGFTARKQAIHDMIASCLVLRKL